MPLMIERLSSEEGHELAHREGAIETALRSYRVAGTHLRAIRDARLYRQDHVTFEAYCQARWGMERAHGYRLIEAAQAADDVSPVGDGTPAPANEAQARPLTRLDTVEERRRVWFGAVAVAEGSPTAELVEQLTNRVLAGLPIEERLKIVNDHEEQAFERTRPIVAESKQQRGERGYTRLQQARKQFTKAGFGEDSDIIAALDAALALMRRFAPKPKRKAS
jgi:hypothetical protein